MSGLALWGVVRRRRSGGGGGQGAVQLRRHERHHVMRAEHAGFMGASRMDVRHTRTTQRNAWNGSCCCCRRLFVLFCFFLFLSVLFWHSREETCGRRRRKVCVCLDEEEEWAVKVQKTGHGRECVFLCVCGRGKQATHRNGILLKLV